MDINKSEEAQIILNHIIEAKLFKDEWLNFIENHLKYINNIIKNPRTDIIDNQTVVPIERAKKISNDSVRHLAANARFIKLINDDGNIIPNKILATQNIDNKATYENRFIKTLIDKLQQFLQNRYNAIKKINKSLYFNSFYHDMNFKHNELDIEFVLKLKIYKNIHFKEIEEKNKLLLDNIEKVSNYINGFINSRFYKSLKNCDLVVAPINKTNIINKDYNYNQCYELWVFLDSQYELNYSIERYVYSNNIDEKALKNLFISVFSKLYQEQISYNDFKHKDSFTNNETKFNVINYDYEKPITKVAIDEYIINEYFYQQSRKVYSGRIKERMDNGEQFHSAFEDVYIGAFKITELIFNDLMEIPQDIKNDSTALLRFKMRNLKSLEEIYKVKLNDLKKTGKAQIKLLKDIERQKLSIEKSKLKIKKPVLSITEQKHHQEKLKSVILKAENRIKLQREKNQKRLKETKANERKKAQLKLKAEKLKAKAKLKITKDKEKAKIDLKIKNTKAKYDTRLLIDKEKAKAKLIKEKAKIWEKAQDQIAKINKDTEAEILRIEEQTKEQIKALDDIRGYNE